MRNWLLIILFVAGCQAQAAPDATLTLDVKGMTCESCASAISQTLEGMEHVRSVEVDVEGGTASIRVASDQADGLRPKIEAAVDNLGYDASWPTRG